MKLLPDSISKSKRRDVARLQDILVFLGGKLSSNSDEITSRKYGKRTEAALKKVKKKISLPRTPSLTKSTVRALNQKAIEKYYSTKTQITKLHKTLTKVARIAKLEYNLSGDVKKTKLGNQTSDALKIFQRKYGLKRTGKLNIETVERLQSVTASRVKPIKKLKVARTERLMKVRNPLRLNMQKSRVGDLQKAMAWVGSDIDTKEATLQVYGKTTRKAVIAFQSKHGLPVTGNVGWKTAKKLNSMIAGNSMMVTCKDKYRVRGSVRNDLWEGVKLATVQVFEKKLRSETLLSERKTLSNGFYDLQYAPPVNPLTGKPKENFQLVVRMLDSQDKMVQEKTYQVTGKVLWANFTEGAERYRGNSFFQLLEKRLKNILGSASAIREIEESDAHQDVTYLRKETSLAAEDIMKMTLAFRTAAQVNTPNLTPEVFYAFIHQNLPHTIPGDLLPDHPEEWPEWIDMLVERTADGIAFLENDLLEDVLNSALKQNYVSRRVAKEFSEILSALKQLKTTRVLEKPMLDGNGTFRMLLDASTVSSSKYGAVAECLGREKGFSDSFWTSLKDISGVSNSAIKDLRTTVELGHITATFPSMLSFLKAEIKSSQNDQISKVSDLARLSPNEWVALIAENGNNVPAWVKGGSLSKRKKSYAAALKANAELRFPAIALIADVGRSTKHALGSMDGIITAVQAKEDFELRKDNLEVLFTSTGSSLTENEIAATKVLQRVHRIAPSTDTGLALLESGFYSAAQIYRSGKEAFIGAMKKKKVSIKVAAKTFLASENQYAAIIAALGKFRFDLQLANPEAILTRIYTAAEITELKKEIPTLETLFGPLDVREVRHCESVLGPSAYLTDLFRFLDQKKSKKYNKTVKDILFKRRPDLGNITLNCKNTNAVLPHIDVVCEILENRVINGNGSLHFQSTWPSEDLIAEPEHVEIAAYEKLKITDYPLYSHLNLWQEETRAFLVHLGVPRYRLMETFLVNTTTGVTKNNKSITAAEYFGISDQEEAKILTTRASNYWQKRYWSNEALGTSVPVSIFLQKSGLTYHQLLDLLQCGFVNGQSPQSTILCPVDNCALNLQKVQKLSLGRMDRANRFIRLWLKTGCTMRELDLLIMDPAIGNGSLNKDFIIALKQFDVLRKELKLEIEEFAAFFGHINTATYATPASDKQEKNLFEKLFLSGSMDLQVYADFALLRTNATTTKNLETYRAHLLSSLSLNNAELDVLLPLTNGKLTRESLSILFRYKTLARKLKLKLEDLFLFTAFANISDPFSSMDSIHEILTKKTLVKESGASLVALEYLLNYANDSSVGLREEVYVQKTQGLRESLAGIQDKITECEDADEDSLAMLLGMLSPFEDTSRLETAMDLIAGTWSATQTEISDFITDHMGLFLPDLTGAINTLKYTTPPTPAKVVERREYVQSELLNYLNQTAIKEFVAVTFNLQSSQAEVLVTFLHLPGNTDNLLTVLQDSQLHERNDENEYLYEISRINLPDIFSALTLLHKASLATTCLRLTTAELTWFVAHPDTAGTLDFNLLPITEVQPSIAMEKWLNLWRFLKFKRLFPEPEDVSFFDVLAIAAIPSSSAEAVNEKLCDLTGWDATDQGLLHNSQLDYTSPKTYEWFFECHRQQKIIGSDFNSLFSWASRDPDTQERLKARQIRDMTQSKYSRSQWLKVLKPIMDDLREKKRDALIAYLVESSQRKEEPEIWSGGTKISNPEYWLTANDLYGWFLIDVEMSSDQLTSRIKQAILTTQLFVQRCFLNLENRTVEVALPDPDLQNSWHQWKWMKNYRIWEANRKVFLYPENWIEPELRDTKTPFFEELESDILSKEITNHNVEGAIQRYIQKLEEVSRLEVCSIFHEINEPTNRLHVVARTQSVPPIFYYRYYDLNYERWSPWEKIETDIQSDHVVPWVYNRKLHLFWLLFQEKPVKLKKLPPMTESKEPGQNPDPAKMLEIELAWIIRQPDGWGAKKTSRQKLIHPWERPTFSYNLKPRYKSYNNSLYIDIYISTSKQFNDNTFYDQFTHDKVRLTKVHYNETLRPWHSSTYVFDGTVKEVLLRGIPGYYFSPATGDVRNISSYQYVKENFGGTGMDLSELKVISEQLALPSGMHYTCTRLTNNQAHDINNKKFNVFGPDKGTRTLLHNARSPFEAVLCQQGLKPVADKIRPLFYQDRQYSFFIKQNKVENIFNYLFPFGKKIYAAYPFYHPFAGVFQQEINRGGVAGLYRRNVQVNPQNYTPKSNLNFNSRYAPVFYLGYKTAEKEYLDFSRSGAYSVYNWELFFHAPLMIACRLSQNQRFEEAMEWFHFIFDPTNTQKVPTPQRFWVTKPFYETNDTEYRKQRIKNIIENIDAFKAQLIEWKNHPFKPHLIAEHRTVAYQRTVVMKYIDNLIAWGDQLFRRDTMESINEATLLYVLAYELLGRRPVMVPALNREEKTFNELIADEGLDTFGNAKVEVALENTLGLPITYEVPAFPFEEEMPSLEISYYGLPHNDKLLKYWDTVEDRLFKIRHGLNIEGLKRQLPLFEPPIDPALLVKAAAAGLDMASVLNDLNAPAQAYRFTILAAKAVEFCHEVRKLGEQLLRSLEKKDAEDLSVLRASHEVTILEGMKRIKKLRIEEVEYTIRSFERRMDACQIRIDHIKSLSETLDSEKKAGDWGTAADVFKTLGQVSNLGAAIASAFPDADAGANGAGGSPKATVKGGGSNVRKGFEYTAKILDGIAAVCKWRQDSLKSEAAGERTKAERESRINDIQKEKEGLEQQMLAQEILKEIAEKDLENFETELEIRETEHVYLRDKYTNSQLYQWMITQVSTVYFQAYQLAYDMAKRSEKSYRRELGLTDTSFIQFGYWDSLKKGLLSADRLGYDIRRMESAYLDQHKRELEITKHVSLARLAPDKLLELVLTGRCALDLEEWMYNLDYPGHYRRRIKSVSISAVCEADEFTNLNCRLTLHDSEVRISNLPGGGYEKDGDEDSRFISHNGTGESIATSHGEYDNGLFTLTFDDERFLPFEDAGAISSWDIHMPKENNQFDFSTITDFVLHISYTAQEGGEPLAAAANAHLDTVLPDPGTLVVGLKYLFPDEWEAFLNPEPSGSEQKLECTISKELYPFLARVKKDLALTSVGLVIAGSHSGNYIARVGIPGQSDIDCTLTKDAGLNNMHHKSDVFTGSAAATGDFSIMVRRDTSGSSDFSSLPPDDLDDIYLILN